MPATFTDLLPETKSEKHGAFTWAPAADNDASPVAGVLTITGKRSHAVYEVSEFPADEGRGFVLVKKTPGTDATEDHYSVFVGRGGVSCECRGFASTGGFCKHSRTVESLLNAGKL